MLSCIGQMVQAESDPHALFHHDRGIEQQIIMTDNVQTAQVKFMIHEHCGRRQILPLAGNKKRNPHNIFHSDAAFLCQRMGFLHEETDGIRVWQKKRKGRFDTQTKLY